MRVLGEHSRFDGLAALAPGHRGAGRPCRLRQWRHAEPPSHVAGPRPQEREQRQAWDAQHRRRLEGLAGLSDEELIAAAEARTSLSHPYHEMEMQPRLKASIGELIADSVRARKSAFWIGAILVVLTLVLVALTVVLAVRS